MLVYISNEHGTPHFPQKTCVTSKLIVDDTQQKRNGVFQAHLGVTRAYVRHLFEGKSPKTLTCTSLRMLVTLDFQNIITRIYS